MKSHRHSRFPHAKKQGRVRPWQILLLLSLPMLLAYLVCGLPEMPKILWSSVPVRFGLLFCFCLLSYLAVWLRGREWANPSGAKGQEAIADRYGEQQQLFRRLFYVWFFCYLHLLLTLTLFDPSLGRVGISSVNSREFYIQNYMNLRPLRSIWNIYLYNGLIRGLLPPGIVLLNLAGNLALLAPLAFFLPLLFRKMRRWYFFFPVAILSSVAIEFLQFSFMRGSCDIDDLFLNVTGAVAVFGILKIPPIARLIRRFTGSEPDKSANIV